MRRIVSGIMYERKAVKDEFLVSVRHLGNGHKEAVVRQAEGWFELKKASIDEIELHEREREESEEHRREANRKRAARRAKTRVRHMVKVAGLDALLTLTYKANQQDLTLCKAHMKEFIRRIRRVLPGFTYVAAYETQKRGAWHIHMATHRLPQELPWKGVKVKSYSVVRAIWRSVTGELGGNIDQQRRRKFSKQSSAKIAAYLSKYMLKAFEDGDDWSNRYSASTGIQVPDAVRLTFRNVSMLDLIQLAYDEIAAGNCECSPWLSKYGDAFFLSTEARPPAGATH